MSHPGPPFEGGSGAPRPDEPTTSQPAHPTVVPGAFPGSSPPPLQYPYPGMYPTAPTGPPGMGPPGVGPPGYPMAGPPPRRSNTTAYLIIGVALLCVVALVVGGVVWWRLSQADDPDLVDGQLAASYPVAPGAEWSITAASMGGQKFNSVIPSEGRYGTVGAIADGETLVTIVGDPYTSVGGSHWAVGVNARTGERWRFGEPVSTCADTIVDHSLVCRDADTLHFIDVRSGAALATVPAPPNTGGVAFNGDAAFVVEYVPATDSVVFHKITRDGPLWSRPVDNLPTAAPGSGDASAFTATDTTVVTSGLRVVGVSADEGDRLVAKAGTSEIGRFDDGTLVLETGDSDGMAIANRRLVVLRPDGTTAELSGDNAIVPASATPGQRSRMLVDGRYTDVRNGTSPWTAAIPEVDVFGSRVVLADDREVIVFDRSGSEYLALDTETGRLLWRASAGRNAAVSGHAVTDGERLITPTPDGGIAALDLYSGSPAWSLPPNVIGNVRVGDEPGPALTFALGDRLVTLTSTTITGFAPTGPRAIVPGTTRAGNSGSGGGGTQYVTPCGSPPVFTPQSFRTGAGGLVVTMKVTAKCPDGDVLFGPQTRLTISDGGGLVASGSFDFRRSPLAVPAPDGGAALNLELTYPPGSFFRLPDTLNDANSAGGQYLVECDRGSTPERAPAVTAPASGRSSASSEAIDTVFPVGADVTATSVNALRLQADADRAFILANLNNRWVAQLSSKHAGLVADGRTWTDQAILDEFLALRLRFNDVRLLWSDEWPVFSYRGWWVTVAVATFPGPVEANSWCRTQGFDPDHCFAKLVSTTAGPEGSTLYRN